MSERLVIIDYSPGTRITDFFVLRKIELRAYDGKPFLSLELGDKSGRIKGSFWGDAAKELREILKPGTVVKIKGIVIERHAKNFFKIDRLRPANHGEYDPVELINSGKHHPDWLFAKWKKRAATISNKLLRNIFDILLKDEQFVSRLKMAPGGKLWHHSYLGGLLEHMLSVERICRLMAKLYPMTDKDLLVAGALLHDIGKVDELSSDSLFIDYTEEGRLSGHIIIGHDKISRIIDSINDFPIDLKKHLLHLILSHHGDLGLGSPVKPLTLEASILHHADMMDSQAAAFRRVINREKGSGDSFSKWVNLAERYLYLKPYQED
ncbi:MAG: 3'-5' exoribonuclease YhaM family protein [Candidatus Zixiibacteriota bacterium]